MIFIRISSIGLVAGALTRATSDFVSVCTQVDIVESQHDRDLSSRRVGALTRLPPPSPTQIAGAASTAYTLGGGSAADCGWVLRDHLWERNVIFSIAAVSASVYT